jgi:hypothetical protein
MKYLYLEYGINGKYDTYRYLVKQTDEDYLSNENVIHCIILWEKIKLGDLFSNKYSNLHKQHTMRKDYNTLEEAIADNFEKLL